MDNTQNSVDQRPETGAEISRKREETSFIREFWRLTAKYPRRVIFFFLVTFGAIGVLLATLNTLQKKYDSLRTGAANLLPGLLSEAENAIETGRFDEAQNIVSRVMPLNPSDPDLLLLQARLHMGREEINAALKCFEKIPPAKDKKGLRQVARHYSSQTGPNMPFSDRIFMVGQIEQIGDMALAAHLYAKGGDIEKAIDLQAKNAREQLAKAHPSIKNLVFNYSIANGKISLDLYGQQQNQFITDISSLAGLPLGSLNIAGSKVENLAALKDMKLKSLNLAKTPVSDISTLAGMPLASLNIEGTKVTDISVLKGMPLENLVLTRLQGITDISVLAGMPLSNLSIEGTKVSDISALAGMPLVNLNLGGTQVLLLEPLRGMKLVSLQIQGTKIADLRPLEGMPITSLNINHSQVASLEPLKGMKISSLQFSPSKINDLRPLEGMPITNLNASGLPITNLDGLQGMTLINANFSNTRITDIKLLAGMPITELNLSGTGVEGLSPLKGAPISILNLSKCAISDKSLAGLAGLPLQNLNLSETAVSDISVLREMPITNLNLRGTKVADISVLAGMPLAMLNLGLTPVGDISPLKGSPLKELYLDECKELQDKLDVLLTCKNLERLTIPPHLRNLEPLKELQKLKFLDDKPGHKMRSPKDFFAEFEKKKQEAPQAKSGEDTPAQSK